MRTLTLTADYPPFLAGGIGLHVAELNSLLVKKGIEPWVITFCPPTETEGKIETKDGVSIVRVPQYPFIASTFDTGFAQQNLPALEASVSTVLKHGSFDLIDCQGYPLGLAAVSLKRLFDFPLIWHVHNILSDTAPQTESTTWVYFRKVESYLAQSANWLVCVSNYIAKRCQELFNVKNDRITVITKAIDPNFFKPCEGKKTDRSKTILFVGRLSPEKGIPILLEALQHLIKDIDVRLLVVGFGTDKKYVEYLIDTARKLKLQHNVFFLGSKEGIELVSMYQQADVVAIPSIGEAFGKVAIEAMATGVPVVVSNVGGLGEIVEDNETGLKVEVNDSIGLAKALHSILTDQQLSLRLAKAARDEVVKNYTWDKIVDSTINVYNHVSSLRN
jgi:glycosyltransferase involved in cell wall biosynthesis